MKTYTVTRYFLSILMLMILAVASSRPNVVLAQDPEPLDKFIYLPVIFNRYPPKIEILYNYTYTINSYDNSISGYGEVINHTSNVVNVDTVSVNTYDAVGKFIKVLYAPIPVSLTPAGTVNDRTCFAFSIQKELRADPDISSFQFIEGQYSNTATEYRNITDVFPITDSILYEDGTIEGHVKNNSERISYYTNVTATYYNLERKVIGCQSSGVSLSIPFEPGQTAAFSIKNYFLDPLKISSLRLQVFGLFAR